MRFVIVSGMSGAGKSTALKMLEDVGYFCVDNLPIALFEKFLELFDGTHIMQQKVALGVDVRSGADLKSMEFALQRMEYMEIPFEILFLDADDKVLIKRYKETRRAHPLSKGERIEKGLEREREKISFLKKDADYIIDTSNLLTRELKYELERIFVHEEEFKSMMITVLSFGFKYGIPSD